MLIYGLVLTVTAPFRLTPVVSLPSGITSSIAHASAYVSSLDTIFPVHETVYIFLYVFVLYEVALFAYKLINWVIRKIPGIS